MSKISKEDILKIAQEEKIGYVKLQFTDILGALKNVEIPVEQLEEALDGEIMFDGSSIEGFVRVEESDMYLKPDYNTWSIFPWSEENCRVARLICDVHNFNNEPFEGDPRSNLKRIVKEMEDMGYDAFNLGPEPEFYLFKLDKDNNPTTIVNDTSGYFDVSITDTSERCRREIAKTLKKMDFEVEMFHHEAGPSQHEISFKYSDAVTSSDNIQTFKLVAKTVARQYGLHVTFMPKPLYDEAGSGMHYNVSLFKDGENVFYDKDDEYGLSEEMKYFMAGLLDHARGYTAICNPLVNSYKRLSAGFEAPRYIAWSGSNRTPLLRIPSTRGAGTRAEVRSLDPSANPYLATAVILKAGLSGIQNQKDLTTPVDENIFEMTQKERQAEDVEDLPTTLYTALKALKADEVIQEALGKHICDHFIKNKTYEWKMYSAQITSWEKEQYLSQY
ncbi:glutamine synthetase [Jeotgalicoccus coquinae]|uniref:Glutamine synthetase n=1 Tax=Jeotgalicoccus coquinae TaxID=709509 RepID=A0A6V7R286_9STAP|nr:MULTISPECIES: type I glutamate--ammonia ligase [Jeotgalicoccus]MBB6423571.1 glutamine synthetase [Jeotgalicoccus coquinae]GGE20911.1 glutamine synthetase [Jeotgalicoccus coquinae]CAD2071430.1 Glutamine synthetase [Jeotgalicoccus coquinae]